MSNQLCSGTTVKELKKLEEQDIVEKVANQLTPWKSPIVVTPKKDGGLFQYKRLNYGRNSAAEIFQNVLQQNLSDIRGVKNLVDDIIIHGKTRKSHDEALEKLSIKTASSTKLESERGKILCNYYSTSKRTNQENIAFKWENRHQKAFEQLKKKLTSTPVMAYFDTKKRSLVIVDGSPYGISAILAQKEHHSQQYKILSYASRALSPVETRYSQTDIEGLSLVWGN
ncbi:Hypothetical predicted protein [Paramuricea clavata]|uniref:Uncharacterized protein n=1 Tax=Paramuricea clavata TaxID=317549 RepID=A0A6S7K4U6_PARCT|nr:Hypothetical predicted protein [Paramuricea clavata]